MTMYRVAVAPILLVVMTAFTGCGGDDETTMTTVTETTASETQAGPSAAELQCVSG